MSNMKIFVSVIIILILGVAMTILTRRTNAPEVPGQYDEFAQCIKDSGTVFYGAFWCSHCQAQKKMFGSSADFYHMWNVLQLMAKVSLRYVKMQTLKVIL